MVIGYHAIFGAYGFWLPNDPRGSWSDFVASWELFRHGQATKVNVRTSLAGMRHDVDARRAAQESLNFPPVRFSDEQITAVAAGFAQACDESGYTIWAAAILPEHVHVVVARSERKIETIIGHLKGRATQSLTRRELFPAERPVWAEHRWKVFLNTPQELRRAIRYVEDNPAKEGRSRLSWPFVTPYAENAPGKPGG